MVAVVHIEHAFVYPACSKLKYASEAVIKC